MARAMPLELRGGRVPPVGNGVALSGEAIGVAVVVELLGNVPRKYLAIARSRLEVRRLSPVMRTLLSGKGCATGVLDGVEYGLSVTLTRAVTGYPSEVVLSPVMYPSMV